MRPRGTGIQGERAADHRNHDSQAVSQHELHQGTPPHRETPRLLNGAGSHFVSDEAADQLASLLAEWAERMTGGATNGS
jgi:hypothetical protein